MFTSVACSLALRWESNHFGFWQVSLVQRSGDKNYCYCFFQALCVCVCFYWAVTKFITVGVNPAPYYTSHQWTTFAERGRRNNKWPNFRGKARIWVTCCVFFALQLVQQVRAHTRTTITLDFYLILVQTLKGTHSITACVTLETFKMLHETLSRFIWSYRLNHLNMVVMYTILHKLEKVIFLGVLFSNSFGMSLISAQLWTNHN